MQEDIQIFLLLLISFLIGLGCLVLLVISFQQNFSSRVLTFIRNLFASIITTIWDLFLRFLSTIWNLFSRAPSAIQDFHARYFRWRTSPYRPPLFDCTIRFFSRISGTITIISVILAVVSLPAIFIPAILGEAWYQILLTSTFGINALDAIILSTLFTVFFILSLTGLIIAEWFEDVFLSNANFGEKLFSLTILASGVTTVVLIGFFLMNIWLTLGKIEIFFLELDGLLFVISLSSLIILSGYLTSCSGINNILWRRIIYILILFSIIGVIAFIAYPAFNSHTEIIRISNKYTHLDQSTFSFNLSPTPYINNSPITLLIQPNFSSYLNSNNIFNIDYADCHWSTNYGFFFIVNTDDAFMTKQSSEFTISNCIRRQNESLYWTYDYSDYEKNKPLVTISLQVEDSNKRVANEKLKNSKDYIVGRAQRNFTWTNTTAINITAV